MVSPVKVIDRLPSFRRSLYNVLDDAVREAARDTLITARQAAPFDRGGLRANSDVHAMGPLKQRVSFWIEYARYQEFGGDGRRTVRHYSTAGTKAHFLGDAGDEQAKKLRTTLKKHSVRARAK